MRGSDPTDLAGRLSLLALALNAPVTRVPAAAEQISSGRGATCRALDALCGQREGCLRFHRELHRAPATAAVRRSRCPMGLLLLSLPVGGEPSRRIEIGPLRLGSPDLDDLARRLRQAGLPPTLAPRLLGPTATLRAVSTAEVEGIVALSRYFVGPPQNPLATPAPVGPIAEEPPAVAAARRLAESRRSGRISLEAAARHVGLSPDHLSRLFRRSVGMPFGTYVNRARIAHARDLLRDPASRIVDIAYACGFESVPHFNRVFRQFEGTSPTGFRRAHATRSHPPPIPAK